MQQMFDIWLNQFTLMPSQDGQDLHCTVGDPGGATDQGITLPSLALFLNQRVVTVADLQRVAQDPIQREAFYYLGYWGPVNGDGLPVGIDGMVFDFGVTDGPKTSAMIAQRAAGVEADGWVGPQTLDAMHRQPLSSLLVRLTALQYQHISTLDPRFQNGWRGRVARAQAKAFQLAGLGSPIGALPTSGSPSPTSLQTTADVAKAPGASLAPTADDLNAQELSKLAGPSDSAG